MFHLSSATLAYFLSAMLTIIVANVGCSFCQNTVTVANNSCTYLGSLALGLILFAVMLHLISIYIGLACASKAGCAYGQQ